MMDYLSELVQRVFEVARLDLQIVQALFIAVVRFHASIGTPSQEACRDSPE